MGMIFRRELGQYFGSPVAYLLAFGFLLLTGLLFNGDLTLSLTNDGSTFGVRATDPALIPLNLAFIMVFMAPVLTMRLLAEESREGTLELLLTAPVSDVAIVVGKFLAAWAFFTLLLLLTLVYQVILVSVSRPDIGHALGAYIGIWLYGGATLAVGVFFSALTENQVVAAFLSISALALLWLGDLAGEIVANLELARVIRQVTLQGHFSSSFAYGVIRGEDVAYFAGIIVVMLFMATRVVGSRRWR
ncbi:MAG: ABC transporter permease subunit [Armatimonadetes bacterium]|nr:ABC transporter permease subunit [Anaerolineae bacterium]